jgi:hypothetical protein
MFGSSIVFVVMYGRIAMREKRKQNYIRMLEGTKQRPDQIRTMQSTAQRLLLV